MHLQSRIISNHTSNFSFGSIIFLAQLSFPINFMYYLHFPQLCVLSLTSRRRFLGLNVSSSSSRNHDPFAPIRNTVFSIAQSSWHCWGWWIQAAPLVVEGVGEIKISFFYIRCHWLWCGFVCCNFLSLCFRSYMLLAAAPYITFFCIELFPILESMIESARHLMCAMTGTPAAVWLAATIAEESPTIASDLIFF